MRVSVDDFIDLLKHAHEIGHMDPHTSEQFGLFADDLGDDWLNLDELNTAVAEKNEAKIAEYTKILKQKLEAGES